MVNKVVFIVPCLRGGGAERVMVLLANAMVEKVHKITFIFTMDEVRNYDLDRRIEIVINNKKRDPLGQIAFIRKYMKENRDAVFVSFFTYQNLYSLLAKIFLPTKVIVSERNDPKKTLYGRKGLERLRNYLYTKADRIVFQTEEAKQYFSKEIQIKGIIICNPLSPLLPEVYEGERDKRIVAVARLNKQKNLPMLISGVSDFLSKNPEYCLEIYGESDPRDPNIKSDLMKLAENKGISGQVKLMGFVSNVTEMIRNASLYVSTSNYEGISNAMLEALAMGLPCVCTDCPVGGARMFVKNGMNGYLVPVGNEELFREALFKALSNKKWGAACSVEASNLRKQLSVNTIAEEWINVLNS